MKNQKDIERGKPENVFDVFEYTGVQPLVHNGKVYGFVSHSRNLQIKNEY